MGKDFGCTRGTYHVYSTIRYVAKGVPLNKLGLPDRLKKLIDLKDYKEK